MHVVSISDLRKARKLHDRLLFGGLNVSIENRKGSVRHWYDKATNTSGTTKMLYPYGYVKGSIGSDGDHVDVFIGPNPNATHAFVIDQMRSPDFTTFDEQKVMLGFDDADEAKKAYLLHFDNEKFFGKMKAMPFAEFARKVLSTSQSKPLVKSRVEVVTPETIRRTPMMRGPGAKLIIVDDLSKAGGPFIGPKGGKWADAQHTIPWKETKSKRARKAEPIKATRATVGEYDTTFETGKSVEVRFIRNTIKSPNMGERFQQHIEPAGRYMTHVPNAKNLPPNMEAGTVRFKNPLVIESNPDPDRHYDENSWKVQLSREFGGKKGKALSRAVAAAGYDGIITVQKAKRGIPAHTGEIVDLTGFDKPTPKAAPSTFDKEPWQMSLADYKEAASKCYMLEGDRSRTPVDIIELKKDGELDPVSGYDAHTQKTLLGGDQHDKRYYEPAKDGRVTIYRAMTGDRIRPGDYVTNSKAYAEDHLAAALRGEGKVVAIPNVKLSELQAMNPNEFFYTPESITKHDSIESYHEEQARTALKEGKLSQAEFDKIHGKDYGEQKSAMKVESGKLSIPEAVPKSIASRTRKLIKDVEQAVQQFNWGEIDRLQLSKIANRAYDYVGKKVAPSAPGGYRDVEHLNDKIDALKKQASDELRSERRQLRLEAERKRLAPPPVREGDAALQQWLKELRIKKSLPTYFIKAGGPYIGPRGGKWADPKHTIPWVSGTLAYASRTMHRGYSEQMDRVQDIIEGVKSGDDKSIKEAAKLMAQPLKGFTGVIVPAPRSNKGKAALLPLAEAIVKEGAGKKAVGAISRTSAVESSRQRRKAGKPGLTISEHADTMAVDLSGIDKDTPIMLVDDMFTTGKTLLAAAKKLREAGHKGPIHAAVAGHYIEDPKSHPDPFKAVEIQTREEPVPVGTKQKSGAFEAELHHGTDAAPFRKFDKTKIGTNRDEGHLGHAAYFSTDPNISRSNKTHIKAQVRLKKPLRISYPKWEADKSKLASEALGLPETLSGKALSDAAKKRGYDGIILDYSPVGYHHQEVAVFDPGKAKITEAAKKSLPNYFIKALPHRYKRRWKNAKGEWEYEYEEPKRTTGRTGAVQISERDIHRTVNRILAKIKWTKDGRGMIDPKKAANEDSDFVGRVEVRRPNGMKLRAPVTARYVGETAGVSGAYLQDSFEERQLQYIRLNIPVGYHRKEDLAQQIRSKLAHEMTHQKDPQILRGAKAIGSGTEAYKEYRNRPTEVTASIKEISRDLTDKEAVGWLRKMYQQYEAEKEKNPDAKPPSVYKWAMGNSKIWATAEDNKTYNDKNRKRVMRAIFDVAEGIMEGRIKPIEKSARIISIAELRKAAEQIYYGPRGGKYLDPEHKIPYRERKGRAKGKAEAKGRGRRKATEPTSDPGWKKEGDSYTGYGGRVKLQKYGKKWAIEIDGKSYPMGQATFDEAEKLFASYQKAQQKKIAAERRGVKAEVKMRQIDRAKGRVERAEARVADAEKRLKEVQSRKKRDVDLSTPIELEPGKPQSFEETIQAAVKTYGADFVRESVDKVARQVGQRADDNLRERATKAANDKRIQELIGKAEGLQQELRQRKEVKRSVVQRVAESLRKDEYAYQVATREAMGATEDAIEDLTHLAVEADKTANPSMTKAVARAVLKGAAGPFLFGFIDNFLLYLAGSGIDTALATMGFSAAAVAGLGNAVSDSIGQAASDRLEGLLDKVGLGEEEAGGLLSEKTEKRIKAASSVVGVFAGALAGMVPLLFGVSFGKSGRLVIGRDLLFKGARPPGSGWHPIPGGKKGGFRRKAAKGYDYWYPEGQGPGKVARGTEPGKFVPREFTEAEFAAGEFDRDPAHWQFVRLPGQTAIVGWTQGGVDPKSKHPVKMAGREHRLYQIVNAEAEPGWARLRNVNDPDDNPLIQHERVYPVKHGLAPTRRRPADKPTWNPGQAPTGPKTGPVTGSEKTIPAYAESTAKKGSALSKVESGVYPIRMIRYFAEDADGVPRVKERWAMAMPDADKVKLIKEFAPMVRKVARQTIKSFGIEKTSETEADLQSAAMEGLLHAIDQYPGGVSFAKHAKFLSDQEARLHAAREFAGGMAMPKRHARLIRGFIAARAEAARIYETDKPTAEQTAQVWKLHKRDIHEGLITGKNQPLPMGRYDLVAGDIKERGKEQPGKVEWAEHLGAFIDGQAKEEGTDFFDRGMGLYEGHGVAGVGMSEHEKIIVRHDLDPILADMRAYKWTEGYRTYKTDASEIIKKMIGLDGEPESAANIAKNISIEFLSQNEWRPLSERAMRRMVPVVFERAVAELRRRVLRSETKGIIERAIGRAIPEQEVKRGFRWHDSLKARAKALTRVEIQAWRHRQREILKRAEQVAIRDGDQERAAAMRTAHDRIKTIGIKRARMLAAEFMLRTAPASAEWFRTAEPLPVEIPKGAAHSAIIVTRTHPVTGAQQKIRVHSLSDLRLRKSEVFGSVPDIEVIQMIAHYPLLSKLVFGSDDPAALAPTLDREVVLELMGLL